MRIGRSIGLALCSAAALFATAAPSAGASCPNEAIRAEQGSAFLPSCMGLELLSPPKKFNQEASEIVAFSPDGARALYKSKAALGGTEGLQSFIGDNYVAVLEAGGWSTHATSPPKEAQIQVGTGTFGGPFAFRSDLAGWTLLGATQSQQYPGEGQFFLGGLDGSFGPLSPLLKPVNDSGTTIQTEISNYAPGGTAADLSATVFPTVFDSTAYLPGDPRNTGSGGNDNSYVAFLDENGGPSLQLLARDGAGEVYGGRCGARLGNGNMSQGAISADGSRIYFSARPGQPYDETKTEKPSENPPCDTGNPLRVMVREEAPGGPDISQLITGGPSEGDDLYQGASLDGSKVFLATPRKLAASDQDAASEACSSTVGASKGCDLYLYDASLPESERLIQVSAGGTGDPDPGKGADVLTSTIALAPDGSHAYFVAQGVLTADLNPAGQGAIASKPNLYLYQRDAAHPSGATSFLGTLAEDDKGKLWGLGRSFSIGAYSVPLSGGEDGGDGHILFFVSKAPLVSSEDGDTGFADIYRYDAAAVPPTLACISCGPELPEADAVAGANEGLEVLPSSNFAEQGRWASEDGETVAFATAQPLAPGDDDEDVNPYLWKEGQLTRLPGNVETIFQRPVVSLDGEVVGFSSTIPLLSQDGDTARDVYLARVNGGFLPPPPPIICNPLVEGNCQGPPNQPAVATAATTDTFVGPGNVKEKARPRCKKGFVRKGGKCVKKPKGKANKKGKQRSKRRAANTRQGGSK
jgi:hypothetical protein